MGSFADSIKASIKELQQEVNDKITKVASDLFIETVQGSPSAWNSDGREAPYADGLLVNQWYLAENKFSNELSTSEDLYGSASLNRANSVLSLKTFLKKDGFVSFTNNVSYGINAEVLGWKQSENPRWKNAPPYAMMDKAITTIKAKIG